VKPGGVGFDRVTWAYASIEMGTLKLLFLEEGAQEGPDVARWLAAIVAQARVTLDLAIYGFFLEGESADILLGALDDRQRAGVRLRVVYDAHATPALPGEVIEPGDASETAAFIAAAKLPARPIGGGESRSPLMHHKFLVVDAGTPNARLWTGSANLTMSAFTLQENNLLDIASPTLVDAYGTVFEELWSTGAVARSGAHAGTSGVVDYDGARANVDVAFAPGQGAAIDHEVARRIAAAKRDVTIASGILSSGRILVALRDALQRGVPVSGIVDLSEMGPILREWSATPTSAWKSEAFDALARSGKLHGKVASRKRPGGPHDYMHNKVLIVDDTVITGSYNFSNHAASNAENILFIESPEVAAAYRAYVARLMQRYPPV
jgi:phosphatidylserine/phosphatidylglycerophosphate/cardiolipin synthase-like enzyme